MASSACCASSPNTRTCATFFPSGDSLAALPHKLDVLRHHCQAVGRNPNDIAITYKAGLAVADTEAEADGLWSAYAQGRGMPPLDSRAGVFIGIPAAAAEQAAPFFGAGSTSSLSSYRTPTTWSTSKQPVPR